VGKCCCCCCCCCCLKHEFRAQHRLQQATTTHLNCSISTFLLLHLHNAQSYQRLSEDREREGNTKSKSRHLLARFGHYTDVVISYFISNSLTNGVFRSLRLRLASLQFSFIVADLITSTKYHPLNVVVDR